MVTIVDYLWSDGTNTYHGSTPSIDAKGIGIYTYELTVTDNRGATSTDTVTIEVIEYVNEAPHAYAGENQVIYEGESVTLDGRGSSDDSGIVSYLWSNNIDKATQTIHNLSVGTHTFTLVVTDADGLSDTASVTIVVNETIAADDETIPNGDSAAITPRCGSFEDVLQTRNDPSKIQNYSGAVGSIYDNPDCSLNTSLVDSLNWQKLTCDGGKATASGKYGKNISVNYDNNPEVATVNSSPSVSTTNQTLDSSATLRGTAYNTVKVNDASSGLNINFTKVRTINNLKLTKNNNITFSTLGDYNLEIGNIDIVNNGSGNTLTTSTTPKNIKINKFELAGGTTVDFETTQTIKMETMTIGRDGSNIKLKAQYIQINTLNQSNSGSGDSTITIVADYIDIGTLDLDQEATIIIKPFTAGKRVLFKSNRIEASSSSTMIIDAGNYYTDVFDIPGSNDIATVKASDNNQLINFFIDGDFKPGNNPGINSEGNYKKFGSLPPKNFMFFVNGDVVTGGGGTTFNATVYVEGSADFGSPSYLRGALSSGGTIKIGNDSEFYYDQNLGNSGWGECGVLRANDDNVSVAINVSQDIGVLQNDLGDSLSIVSTSSGPAHGTVSINGGSITYTPNTDYAGTDRFNYTIRDANGATDTATVYILVSAPHIDADAGVDQNIGADESTSLDASGSTGSCSPLRYNWTYNGGYTATGIRPTIPADTLNSGNNTITLTVRCENLSDTDTVVINVMETIENADDICYGTPITTGFDMGFMKMMYRNELPLKNSSDDGETLTDVVIITDIEGMGGDFMSDCGSDHDNSDGNDKDGGECRDHNNGIDMPMGSGMTFNGKTTTTTVDDDIEADDDSNSVWSKTMFEMSMFFEKNLYASYVKDGKKYIGSLKSCNPTATSFDCSNPKDFSIIHQENVTGNIKLIGNTNICMPKNNDRSNSECVDPGNTANNDINAIWRNGDSNTDTQSASSAKLVLPPNSKILWAGLYWQGNFQNSNSDELKESQESAQYIKLGYTNAKGKQNVTYESLKADRLNHIYFTSKKWFYQGFKDVTEFVEEHGVGWYWGADLQTKIGDSDTGPLGAWSISIIYYNGKDEMKNLTVFDGYLAITTKNMVDAAERYATSAGCDKENTGVTQITEIDLEGFKTPKSGTVNSRLIFFAGEGDIKYKGDNLFLKNNSDAYVQITNTTNPNKNIANSSITDYNTHRGENLLYPYYGINTIGIDIDTFDVSGIIGNSQTKTTAKMNSKADWYFPGVFGLSTDLYTPDICYDFVTKRNESIIPFSDKTAYEAYTRKNDEISFNIAIWDIKGDINPRYTSIGLNVNQTKGSIRPIVNPDKAYYSTPNSNTLLPTDYANSMSTVHRPVITIGKGRTADSGGMLKADERYYTKFYYKVNSLGSDGNNSIAGTFTVDVNGTMNYGSGDFWQILGTTRCPQNPIYDPTWYQFNVEKVWGNNVPNDETKHYSLPTRVAGKDFNYEVAAYTKDGNDQYTVASAADGITVDVELIDIGSFDDNSSVFKCGNADPAIIVMPGKFSHFSDNASRILVTDENDLASTYAVRNTTFRMWMLVDENGTINTELDKKEKTDNSYFKSVYERTFEREDPNGLCASACKSPYNYTSTRIAYDSQATGCYACLRDYFAKPYCARDNFAIRPKAIRAKIIDLGKDGNSTTQSSFIAHNDSSKEPTNQIKIAAEYPYEFNLTAVNDKDEIIRGYNTIDDFSEKLSITNNLLVNKKDTTEAFVKFNSTDTSKCDDDSSKTIKARFFDGIAITKYKQDNVGKYDFEMWDSNFTMVDKSYNNPNKTLFDANCKNSALSRCNDCFIDKTTINPDVMTEKLGCIFGSTIDGTSGSDEYTSLKTTLRPYAFSLELSTENLPNDSHPEWLYMNNLKEDINMGVNIGGTVTARGLAGSKLTNYTESCVAEDDIKVFTSYTTTPSTIVDENDKAVNLMRKVVDKDTKVADDNITITKSGFKFEDNGSAIIGMTYNLDRELDTRINVSDVNFTTVNVYGSNKTTSNFENNHTADGNITLNDEKRFFYARVKEMKGTDGQEIFAPDITALSSILVSTYCQDDPSIGLICKDEAQFGSITERIANNIAWFRMSNHSSDDGQVTNLAPSATLNGLNISPYRNINLDTNGSTNVISFTYPVTDRPARPIIEITPDEWLKYNADSDKEGINSFQLNFLKTVQEWKGVGNTGNVINTRPNSQKHNRMGW